jgi:hypothetical protein
MDKNVVAEKIAGAMPLHLSSFFNCYAIVKGNKCIYRNPVEVEEP